MSLRNAVRKAYKGTALYKLRQLFDEESRWLRKSTIARNKLTEVRKRINQTAEELAKEKAGVDPNEDAKTVTAETENQES